MDNKKIVFLNHVGSINPIGTVNKYTLILKNGIKETYDIGEDIPSVSFSQVDQIIFTGIIFKKENTHE